MEFEELDQLHELPEVKMSCIECTEPAFVDLLASLEFSTFFFCNQCGRFAEGAHECFRTLSDVSDEHVQEAQKTSIFQPALASVGYSKILKRLPMIPEELFGTNKYHGLSLKEAKFSYGLLDALLDLFRDFVNAKILSVRHIDISRVYYCGFQCLIDPTGIVLSTKANNREGFIRLFEKFSKECVKILQDPRNLNWERGICSYLHNCWLYRNRTILTILEKVFGFNISYRPVVDQFLIQLQYDGNNLELALENFMKQPRSQRFRESSGNPNFFK